MTKANTKPEFGYGDSARFWHGGREYEARVERDDAGGTPWENEDGHGPVSGWETRGKAPGEMVLCGDGRGGLGTDRAKRFYDFAQACRIARRDGWGFLPGPLRLEHDSEGMARGVASCREFEGGRVFTGETVNHAIRALYDAHAATMTPRQYAAAAAFADFNRLRAFCADEWHYLAVTVAPVCGCCGMVREGHSVSLCGVESDCPDHIADVAAELAGEVAYSLGESEADDCEAEG